MTTEDIDIIYEDWDEYTIILENGDILSFAKNDGLSCTKDELTIYLEENNLDIHFENYSAEVDLTENVIISDSDYRAYADSYGGEVNNFIVTPLFMSNRYCEQLKEFDDTENWY